MPTLRFYVRVVDFGGEPAFRRLEWVFIGNYDVQKEDAARVERIRGAEDGALPVELISFEGPCGTFL